MHAEIDLLSKIGDKANGCKVYIYRFNNTTCPNARQNKNGKPCAFCQHALKNAGISRVTYIDDFGNTNILKNRDMINLVGEPSNITGHFLERYGDAHHGKFIVNEFIAA